MQHESRLGRALWLILLVLLGGYVVADFVRSPFSAPRGSAAVRPAAMTIWTPAAEAGDEAGTVLTQAAAGLELNGHRTVVKVLAGGSAGALISFLSEPRPGRGRLLAITSTTLADLAHDRQETLVPGAAEEAMLARALLRHSHPIGILASDPLQVAVEQGSTTKNATELVEELVAEPERQLFGIDDETFSRDQLAALVQGAGIDGEVHFMVFQSGAEAGQAIETGAAGAVLAPRPALRPEIRSRRLRNLGWPLPGPAPRAWVGLLAPPDTNAREIHRSRQWLRELLDEPRLRTNLRQEGRRPADGNPRSLAFLLRHTAAADELEAIAQRVERR